MPDNHTFTYKYHADTIKQGKALKNEDGSITTVRVIGVPYKGRIYNVPSYDRETGTILSEEQALKRFLPNINKGEVESFGMKFNGPIDQHPANIAARTEHQLIEADQPKALKAIGYSAPKVAKEFRRKKH